MDFFEEFSGLGELQSPEAKRQRLWVYGALALIFLAVFATLYQLGFL